jgi:hypothetical protein
MNEITIASSKAGKVHTKNKKDRVYPGTLSLELTKASLPPKGGFLGGIFQEVKKSSISYRRSSLLASGFLCRNTG